MNHLEPSTGNCAKQCSLRLSTSAVRWDTRFYTSRTTRKKPWRLSDLIAVYHEGRIEQIGTPESIYRHPATLFVATFVGEFYDIPREARTLWRRIAAARQWGKSSRKCLVG